MFQNSCHFIKLFKNRNLCCVTHRKLYSLTRSAHPTFSYIEQSLALNASCNPKAFSSSLREGWTSRYHLPINACIRLIENDSVYKKNIKELIPSERWLSYLQYYRRKLIKDPSSILSDEEIAYFEEIFSQLSFIESSQSYDVVLSPTVMDEDKVILNVCAKKIFALCVKLAESELKSTISFQKLLQASSDLRLPHEWYPYARVMKRKIYYHGGPTNSGKTYQALQRLRNANPDEGGGIFCGPLRLLALEIYEKLNQEGAYTNLLTGQEKRFVPFASHVACTIEMAMLDKDYDVAVIDEIQMIADPFRGWAWTRALLGLRAKEIHLCGGLEAFDVVQRLLSSTGDELILKSYDRLSTLKVADESLKGDYKKVRRGDCIVAFTKADIFSIRHYVEKNTSLKCAVIYGQLPPEVRSMQARLFNEGKEYDILIASDAIGMGLNLNIGRIIFHTTRKKLKSISKTPIWVEPSSIKQIAGRAGRLSSQFKVGEVTSWQDADLPYIKAVMASQFVPIPSAGIFPVIDQVQSFYSSLQKSAEENNDEAFDISDDNKDSEAIVDDKTPPVTSVKLHQLNLERANLPLSFIMNKFVELSKVDSRYFMCRYEELNRISNWLHSIPLSIEDRFVLASAPVDTKNASAMNLMYKFAAQYALNRPVALNIRFKTSLPRDFFEFADLCTNHNFLELYLWLSIRFPKHFVERDLCVERKLFAMELIQKSLEIGRIRQDYSHVDEYRKSYQSTLEADPEFLPPKEYIGIREATKALRSTHAHIMPPLIILSTQN